MDNVDQQNDVEVPEQQQQLSPEELTRQRIQKRKEEAKRLIEERKKRDNASVDMSNESNNTSGDGEEGDVAIKKKSTLKPVRQQQQQQVNDNEDDDEEEVVVVKKKKSQAASVAPPVAATTPGLREDLVRKAVTFLTNPNVKNTALGRKVAYLEKRGMTPEEIKEALMRHEELKSGGGITTSGTNTTSSTRSTAGVSSATPRRSTTGVAPYTSSSSSTQLQSYQPQQQQQQVYQPQQQQLQQQQPIYSNQMAQPMYPGDRRQQVYAAANTFSWGNVLMSVTALVGVASGLAYLTSNYILPYFRKEGGASGEQEKKTEKKISDLQEQINLLQQAIATQSSEFKEMMQPLKALTDGSFQKQATSEEIGEIKRELNNLSSLIANSNNNASQSLMTPILEDSDFRIPPLPSTTSSQQNQQLGATGGSLHIKGGGATGAAVSKQPARRVTGGVPPPISVVNPYSNLTWKPNNDSQSTIPSWQQQQQRASPNTTIGATTTTTTTTTTNSLPSYSSLGMSPASSPSKPKSEVVVNDFDSKPTTSVTPTSADVDSFVNTTNVVVEPPAPQPKKDDTPYSTDFVDIINQVKQGKTPPGIRNDINNTPINGAVNKGVKERPLKPWEKSNTSLSPMSQTPPYEDSTPIFEPTPMTTDSYVVPSTTSTTTTSTSTTNTSDSLPIPIIEDDDDEDDHHHQKQQDIVAPHSRVLVKYTRPP
ncbi:hypothetical protein SAMD00019534_120490 [Acytostelium subglobosum LB1]|uniref:hypothetical protein n=1 Tax=Acytostelium subglobosum LB1 TaxID=1410327 RepID=UPI0006447FDF|nr:hypothetical protein SAMD00019534_120490 [Acytostelium subglobosum LB1]GAM28873.1 hypothetical protein SAMD00019534_120490 [Acytostelium subglobosum LB1]|eukprot:XP_012748245.1 hypothetical protein SAMD00019534_120490 [Acytostelium subglobosum LB1]